MRNERMRQVGVVGIVLMMMLIPTARALVVCNNPFLVIDGAVDPVVDIDCETGTTLVSNATVNLLPGAHISDAVGGGTGTGNLFTNLDGSQVINVYGGKVDGVLQVVPTDIVTVYVSSVEPIPGLLEPGDTQIVFSVLWDSIEFDLVGVYQDGTPFTLPICLSASGGDSILNLNAPQTAPDISVSPALHFWDLGDIEVGQSTTMGVTVTNNGNADLNVSSVTISGSPDFQITSGPVGGIVIAPSFQIGADFEVTYSPTATGEATAVVQILSDDEDESVIEISLVGNGIVTEVPPQQQVQNILDYFDDSVAIGTLLGYGPGNSPAKRLNALHNMIESTSDLINAGEYALAIDQLGVIEKKTDGVSKPQDFVTGEATSLLNTMINDLIADLAS